MVAEIVITAKLSDLITTAVKSNVQSKLFSEDECCVLDQDLDRKFLSTTALRLLAKYLKKENIRTSLQDYLKGSKKPLHFPGFISKEISARREYLQKKQQARQYNMMMYGKERIAAEDESVSATLKSAKYQIAISSNMLVTIVAVFGMVYYASLKIGFSNSQAMVFGLIGSIIMLAVEMVLYIIRTIKMEQYASKSFKNPETALKINES